HRPGAPPSHRLRPVDLHGGELNSQALALALRRGRCARLVVPAGSSPAFRKKPSCATSANGIGVSLMFSQAARDIVERSAFRFPPGLTDPPRDGVENSRAPPHVADAESKRH